MKLRDLVEYLDDYLAVGDIPDADGACNGLQVANSGTVRRVAAAVDASEAAIQEAARRDCDFLLVHHGLFWDRDPVITGRRYRKIRALIGSDTAVYGSHLPLDVHAEVGNNAVLAEEIGLTPRGRFGDYHGVAVGIWGDLTLRREALAARLDEILGGPVRMIPGGPERLKRVGIVTGGGSGMIASAIETGLDALVTGEGPHHSYFEAMEGGLTVYFGGHYATETWGVRALAAHLERRFDLPWEFLHLPTGL